MRDKYFRFEPITTCEAVATSQKKFKDDDEKDANVFRIKKKIDLVAQGTSVEGETPPTDCNDEGV